jgi:hypothetical protein
MEVDNLRQPSIGVAVLAIRDPCALDLRLPTRLEFNAWIHLWIKFSLEDVADDLSCRAGLTGQDQAVTPGIVAGEIPGIETKENVGAVVPTIHGVGKTESRELSDRGQLRRARHNSTVSCATEHK